MHAHLFRVITSDAWSIIPPMMLIRLGSTQRRMLPVVMLLLVRMVMVSIMRLTIRFRGIIGRIVADLVELAARPGGPIAELIEHAIMERRYVWHRLGPSQRLRYGHGDSAGLAPGDLDKSHDRNSCTHVG